MLSKVCHANSAYAIAVDLFPSRFHPVRVQPILKALGQRIRELRSGQGYSQESFADHCGVHRTFMGTIERGESNLSFSNLVKVSQGLSITLAELLSGLEKKAAQSAKERSSRT
jgi:DNA-binding XRE family transcriptional regulator